MIAAVATIGAGVAFLVLVAIVVGIVDAANASSWRQVAAERRQRWEESRWEEARSLEFHGAPREPEMWDED